MTARQNPLLKIEAFMQRIVETPFAFIFPSRLEPAEIRRKLERAMEDNLLLQGEGRRLAPNVYDIYLSIKDHQQLSQSFAFHINDWQTHLVEFARQRHYILKTNPVLRLHTNSALRPGGVRIDAELVANAAEGGIMATQALSAEQLAKLRAQLSPAQQLPHIAESSPSQSRAPTSTPSGANSGNNARMAPVTPVQSTPGSVAPAMPQAWLTIRLPQANEQIYRIDKPVVNIGRQLSNDIIVEDKRVSRYHAQIKYQDGQFAIYDLGSTNGITINHTPSMRQHTLRNGDFFTIGSYDFYFQRR